MRILISFLIMMMIKVFSHIFYRLHLKWLSEIQDFKKIRLIVILNHTSLYEPIFVSAVPVSFVWRFARKMVIPGANKTLDRPIVGLFWKLIGGKGMISITRKRDKSWQQFLQAIENRSMIAIAPEGRMMRKNGLDAYGKPMSIKSGIADILFELNEGRMLIAYSGGLHHIQHPGQLIPRLFKDIHLNLEVLEINDYKANFSNDFMTFKNQLVSDLELRLKNNRPLS